MCFLHHMKCGPCQPEKRRFAMPLATSKTSCLHQRYYWLPLHPYMQLCIELSLSFLQHVISPGFVDTQLSTHSHATYTLTPAVQSSRHPPPPRRPWGPLQSHNGNFTPFWKGCLAGLDCFIASITSICNSRPWTAKVLVALQQHCMILCMVKVTAFL